MIPQEILERFDARLLSLDKGETIFEQGATAAHFFIVRDGRVKMATYNDEGREFVQGYFGDGQSFGEPPFFNNTPYPASAIAVEKSTVWKIPRSRFLELLRENFDIHLALTQVLSGRLIYKAMMLTEIAVEEAEHRLTTLIDYFRRDQSDGESSGFVVPFTRQQLAEMTGLRVETVIRVIKSMETRGLLRIKRGKIVWTDSNQ